MSKRGRPPFKPTPKQRRAVEQMVSVGESKATIARALRVDEDTLTKHFADELTNGRARRRMEVTELLFKAARAGNVTAQKKLEDMTAAAASIPEPMQPRPAKLGKKEQALADAQNPDPNSTLGELIAKRQSTLN